MENMNNGKNRNFTSEDKGVQYTTKCRISEDGSTLSFKIPLGQLTMDCVVDVPADGTETTARITGALNMTIPARVKDTAKGMEMITFSINLNILKIICLAHIPEEGEEFGIVYEKFKFFENKVRHNANRSDLSSAESTSSVV